MLVRKINNDTVLSKRSRGLSPGVRGLLMTLWTVCYIPNTHTHFAHVARHNTHYFYRVDVETVKIRYDMLVEQGEFAAGGFKPKM